MAFALKSTTLPEPMRAAVNVQATTKRNRERWLKIEAEYVAEVLAGVDGNKTEARANLRHQQKESVREAGAAKEG
jgi:regulator of protease activity HflC (stomatin/prohibitin superfamily)